MRPTDKVETTQGATKMAYYTITPSGNKRITHFQYVRALYEGAKVRHSLHHCTIIQERA